MNQPLPVIGSVTLLTKYICDSEKLATNAAKYGALSVPGVCVTIRWSVTVDRETRRPDLTFDWVESGGPPVQAPSRKSFGTKLIEMGLSGAVGSEVTLDYRPDGLRCHLTASLTELQVDDD